MSSPTLYFFNGATYIRWTVGSHAGRRDDGYPMNVVDGWHGPDSFMNKIDAAVNGEDGKMYFLRDDEYISWSMAGGRDGRDSGYPRKITSQWPHPFLANGVDAAVNMGNGLVCFFKGSEYLCWQLGVGLVQEPVSIAAGWHSFLASGVDAAFNWGNEILYFFKDDHYLRWNIHEPRGSRVPSGYPKKIAGKWDSFLDNGIQAAVNWDPVPNFTFDSDIAPHDVALLKFVHAYVLARIAPCGFVSDAQKARLVEAYRRPIRNGTEHNPANFGSQQGDAIFVNFERLRGDWREMAQTVIHEMMHVAGYVHPPKGTPGYYDTPPLKAEMCIRGQQSDRAPDTEGELELGICAEEKGACVIRM